MKYAFPAGLYADVRIEHVFSTSISYVKRELRECKEQKYSAAFVRVFDGKMWYYSSTSDLNGIQAEIDALAALATPNPQIRDNPIVKNMGTHKDVVTSFVGREIYSTDLGAKTALLERAMPQLEANEHISHWRIYYLDNHTTKEFYNCKGAELVFDRQQCGFGAGFTMTSGERMLDENYSRGGICFQDLGDFQAELAKTLTECQDFMLNSEAVERGKYTVIFAPEATGIFTHECFGHKSESDFMLGDEATRKEWALGKQVGAADLTISESGSVVGSGFTPYDDEGNKATMTHLVKNGILTGRLHNAASAADLGEAVTGNARAMNFEYEPVVRMTTTYIDKGNMTQDELISSTKRAILMKSVSHGSGASTFTIASVRSYLIEDGKVTKPVRVSVVTGNVFEALGDIDGISDKIEMCAMVGGGCGKMGQGPLAVGFGGPYIRVNNMEVQ